MKVIILSLLVGINALADEGHRHYHGLDAKTKKPCELMVEHEYFENDVTTKENYRALILTSYTVFDDNHQYFYESNHLENAIVVQFSAKNPKKSISRKASSV